MRALLAIPLFALAACQVTKDEQNDTVTATYNEEVAENAVEDVGNFAEDVGNDVENTAEKVENRVDKIDVDVDTNTEN
jgi:hypothetical protein